jgi:spore photoproduct lyase
MFNKTTELLSTLQFPKIPNQCDSTYYTFDIGTNTDVSLMHKFLDIDYIWDYFKNSEKGKAVFATKYVNSLLLNKDPERKVRIRFSLMPQKLSSVYEPKTSLIEDRINAVKDFIEAGYEVHLNFSPVIWGYLEYEKWNKELFTQVNDLIPDKYKDQVHCEVIFLTHNEKLHQYNVENNLRGEKLLWNPEFQEAKTTSYGGSAVRYKHQLKYQLVDEYKKMHSSIIPWCKIRYIF